MSSYAVIGFLFLLTLMNLTSSHPVPGSDIFRKFYEKPEINAIQGKLIQLTNPKPVVDTLTEAEKCCNTQQHLIGRKFLGAYETISSSLANLSQVPKQTADKVGATVTVVLNQIGGKIVGLQ